MNRSRYEAHPPPPSNQPILISPILQNHPSYNYNSGTPTSAPSSHRPSITSITSSSSISSLTSPPSFHSSQREYLGLNAQSFGSGSSNSVDENTSIYNNRLVGQTSPFSPCNSGLFNYNGISNTGSNPIYSPYPDAPPSFHTYSNPGSRASTPRTTPSTRTIASNISGASEGSGIDLWGIATTTSGGTEEDREGSDGVMIMKGLERRMERLEECIGRLLNEELRNSRATVAGTSTHDTRGYKQNCCVIFSDTPKDLENAVLNDQSNCCVRFSSSSSPATNRRRRKSLFVAIVLLTILLVAFGILMNGYMREVSVREMGSGV